MKLRILFVAAMVAAIGTGKLEVFAATSGQSTFELVRLPEVSGSEEALQSSSPQGASGPAAIGSVRVKGDAEAAQKFYSPQTSIDPVEGFAEEKKSSFRWLGFGKGKDTPKKNASWKEVLFGLPEVVQVTTESEKAPQPKAALNQPVAIVAPTQSSIVRTQANQDVFYNAMLMEESVDSSAAPADPPAPTDAVISNSSPVTEYSDSIIAYNSCCGDTCCGDTCCGDSCCGDTCCGGPNCCCSRCCRRRCMLVGGIDAVFLDVNTNGISPSFSYADNSTPQYYHYTQGNVYVPGAGLDDFYMAPRIWAGVQGCCWGIVGRYFHLRAGEHDSDMYVPTANHTGIDGQGFDAYSIFDAYYADIELTRNFCCCCAKNQLSFGVRYALIEDAEGITVMADIPDDAANGVTNGLINGGARHARSAHGTGLTFGLNGRRPLFCNSCAHWYYAVRGSVLWGCTYNEVETWSELVDTSGANAYGAGAKNGATTHVNDDLFIGEVQLGLQWDFALRCLPARAFFRGAFEYQYWDSSIGNATAASAAGIVTPNLDVSGTALAFAPGIRADLIGFHIGTGFTW